MTTTQLIPTTTTSAAQASVGNGLAAIANNYQTFLSLLTSQLSHQDPLSPMDTSQFTQQLTQMTGVEQQLLSNQLLQQLVNQNQGAAGLMGSVGLIGKTVSIDGSTSTLAGGQATFEFALPSAPASMTVSVLDSNGNTVWSGPVSASGSGAQTFTWDGKTSAGGQEPDGGSYTLKVSATDASGAAITPTTTVSGQVTGVSEVSGQTVATVAGAEVPISSITGVSQ